MRVLIPLLCLVSIAGCRGPCPGAPCPPAPSCEPRDERAGPPPCDRAERCERPERCAAAPPALPQRVIIEVVQKSAPAAPPPLPPAVAAPAPSYAPPSYAAAGQLVPVQYAAQPAGGVQSARLGFALDYFRLPIPFLRPVAVPVEREAAAQMPALMVMQAPAQQYAPPMYAPPVQYAQVPLTGTGLVPVQQASMTAAVCPPCPPCPGGELRPEVLAELQRQLAAMRAAIAAQRKAAEPE